MTMTLDRGRDPNARERSGYADTGGLLASDRTALVAFLVLLLALRLVLMIWLPLTDTTEARYAEIARKMVETGDWITPQFDYGVPFWGKPPLHSWASALGMKLFGVGPFGGRIFILAAALSVLWLVLNWAVQWRSRDVGLVTVAVCGSSLLFFGASAFVMTDMVMVLGTTLAMIAFFRAVTTPDHSAMWGHLFFVGLAIGLLAKGPTAVVLTGIPVFLWLLIGNRWRLLRRVPWLSGVALCIVLTAPWYIAAEIKTPGFLQYFLVGEHIERFLVPGWQGDLYGSGHKEAKGMIWIFAIGAFLPWTLFPLAFLTRPRVFFHAIMADATGRYSYLLFWSLSPLILFTPAANILPSYVLPAVPALSLLTVALWEDAFGLSGHWTRRFTAVALVAVSGLFATTTLTAYINPDVFRLRSMKSVVAEANVAIPMADVYVYPARSYSAEFYTSGRVKTLETPAGLQGLAANGTRDAVIVPLVEIEAVSGQLGPRFDVQSRTARYALFVESPL